MYLITNFLEANSCYLQTSVKMKKPWIFLTLHFHHCFLLGLQQGVLEQMLAEWMNKWPEAWKQLVLSLRPQKHWCVRGGQSGIFIFYEHSKPFLQCGWFPCYYQRKNTRLGVTQSGFQSQLYYLLVLVVEFRTSQLSLYAISFLICYILIKLRIFCWFRLGAKVDNGCVTNSAPLHSRCFWNLNLPVYLWLCSSSTKFTFGENILMITF